MYQKSFREVDLELTIPPSESDGGGEGGGSGGQPTAPSDTPGPMEKLAMMLQPGSPEEGEEMDGDPHNGEGPTKLSYKKTKEKIEKQIVRNMVEKLVCEPGRKKVFGPTFYHKKKIARDLTAGAEIRIPRDTYDLNREPVAFYFDFSGSCEEYSGMFAQMTAGLIAKGATTYIGMNGYTDFRIDKAPATCDSNSIIKLLQGEKVEGFVIHSYDDELIEDIVKKERIRKIVIYTDYDADQNCIQTSEIAEVLWFCAQRGRGDIRGRKQMKDFKGKFFQAYNLEQIKTILSRLDDVSFERLNRKRQLGIAK